MEQAFWGKLIEYERMVKKISLNKLTKGVCSPTTLHRLEYGKRIPCLFIMERILERLGKSINKVEFLYYESDYDICYLRELIEDNIEKKEYKEAYRGLEYYQNLISDLKLDKMQTNIHYQYLEKIAAVLFIQEEKHVEARQLLVKAIERTIPEFTKFLKEREEVQEGQKKSICNFMQENLVQGEEFNLLLLWIQEINREKKEYDLLDGREILEYIKTVYEDEEMLVNAYSKAAWIFGSLAYQSNNIKEAYWYMREGKNVLTQNGRLYYLPQFLEKISLLSAQVDSTRCLEWEKQKDALKLLYEENQKEWETEEPHIWKNYRQQELYLLSELVVQERKLVEKSQWKLAEDTEIDLKTINRIEKGRFKPKPGTFRKLKEYFRIHRDICSTRIVTEDFALLELERKIAKLNHYRKEAEAEELYIELKKKLSLEWKENQQYIIYMDMLFDHQLGRISTEKALEECKRAFAATRENFILEHIDEIVPNRMESFIINYICKCYDILERKEDAVSLLEKTVIGYENSKIQEKYHYVGLSLLYEHLAIGCEEIEKFDRGIYWCDKAIHFDLECKRGSNLGFLLEQKTFTMERKGLDKEQCKQKYLQSYQLLKLMNQKRHMTILQNYMENYLDIKSEEIN